MHQISKASKESEIPVRQLWDPKRVILFNQTPFPSAFQTLMDFSTGFGPDKAISWHKLICAAYRHMYTYTGMKINYLEICLKKKKRKNIFLQNVLWIVVLMIRNNYYISNILRNILLLLEP